MTTACRLLAFPLVLLMSASAAAQHVVPPQQLAATVAEHIAQQDADRAAVREALARPEVRAAAKRMNVDMDTVMTTAGTLTGVDLAQAAHLARRVNQQLVGGDSTVTVSTTTVILALLLIILLIVALK